MNEFQYNSTPQEQAMADLLKSQSHRLARQQIIFALILFTLILTGSLLLITQAGTRWLGLNVNTATTALAS